jgi:hypothetical protein
MEKEKTYTRRQRLENWFYYNKLWVLVGVVILWVVGSMLWNVLGIGRTEPDFRILYVGSRQLPEDCVQALEQALAALAEDSNGDGTVTVVVTQCVTTSNGALENQLYGYGSEITVLADITEGESHFFLLEDPVDFQLSFQVLANLDGSIPAEDDFEAMNKVYRWADCPALASLELGTYEDSYLDITETGEVQDLLKDLYLGRRYFYDPARQKDPEADNNFWHAITEGATP